MIYHQLYFCFSINVSFEIRRSTKMCYESIVTTQSHIELEKMGICEKSIAESVLKFCHSIQKA